MTYKIKKSELNLSSYVSSHLKILYICIIYTNNMNTTISEMLNFLGKLKMYILIQSKKDRPKF